MTISAQGLNYKSADDESADVFGKSLRIGIKLFDNHLNPL